MKLARFILCTLYAGFTLTFISCTDHQVPEESQWRVKSLTRVLPDSPGTWFISQFSYDADGKIGSIFTYQTPDSASSQTEKSIYKYDPWGRLSQMERTLSTSGSERYVYNYDQSGLLSKINYTGALNDFYDVTFTYDSSGKLLSSKRSFHFFSAFSYEQLINYSFSTDDLNSIHSETTFSKGVSQTSIVNSLLVFDGHKNPFYGNYIIPAPVKIASPITGDFQHYTYYGGIDNFLHLNKNNLVSSLVKGLTQTSYAYTYHASGMPASRKTLVKVMLDRPEVLEETLYYEYEQF
ncbi:hypothetical protein [Dyadobacter luticola]|uniref:DUF4595 domain-containing protein n=1 Tax=Dyadobacter luticola TaxID=1979387 RepID=A0A5R9L1Y0_9BACT|nr:hypothetical protein [Dyadobacter luticola]TLV02421.1 hypothetical protein FEN17_01950 [Dyadobacter luticola]